MLSTTLALLRSHGLMLLSLSLVTAGLAETAPLLLTQPDDGPFGPVRILALLGSVMADILLVGVATAAAIGAGAWRTLPARLPWALLVGLGAGLGQALGYVLLIVPGVILTTMWIVAAPICIAERPGFAALDRSAALTHGRRWSVFALMIGFVIGSAVFSYLISTLALAGLGQAGAAYRGWAGVLNDTLVSTVGAAGVAALYVELVKAAEGPSVKSVADVFS